MNILGKPVRLVETGALVVGSGCAGLNCADWLTDLGVDTLLITEDMGAGTSRNAGSDKQTYYKLSLSGDADDSPERMARDMVSEGMHGDEAYVEAANSAACFLKLARLGVPFPTNRMGEYVGYKTDHDPRSRATSAGPLTSRYMAEALEASLRKKGARMLDGYTALKVLAEGGRCAGCVAAGEDEILVILAPNVVLCTGGPARLYEYSAFPERQWGMSSLAIEAGAKMANMHQWQYGLATVKFRWNVSGTYQQAMPRYVSVGKDGEYELLPDQPDARFLKGYQWPFDVRKAEGSSMVDLAVHRENEKGRRVYLDYTRESSGMDRLGKEARDYLLASGAGQGTPYGRLLHMNPAAARLYLDHGIDLSREMAEVRVCAQHHNGGAAVDINGETNVPGLYAAGECAGTFGAYRPGGSALNAGQVTSMRAAQHIAQGRIRPVSGSLEGLKEAVLGAFLAPKEDREAFFRRSMSACGAHLRSEKRLMALFEAQDIPLRRMEAGEDIRYLAGIRDAMITRRAVISAMLAAARIYGSDGSGMVLEDDGTFRPHRQAENAVLETGADFVTRAVPARPIPRTEQWFENVWRDYRSRMGIGE